MLMAVSKVGDTGRRQVSSCPCWRSVPIGATVEGPCVSAWNPFSCPGGGATPEVLGPSGTSNPHFVGCRGSPPRPNVGGARRPHAPGNRASQSPLHRRRTTERPRCGLDNRGGVAVVSRSERQHRAHRRRTSVAGRISSTKAEVDPGRLPRTASASGGGRLASYAAEADMTHPGVDHLRAARRRTVAQAVGVGAQVRAALDHLATDPELWLAWVVALLEVAPARVVRDAARRGGVLRVAVPPVVGPLPDVAGHVLEAEPVGGEAADGRGARVAALLRAPPREVRAVPGVRHDPATRASL